MCVQCTFTIQWAKCPWADVGCSWPLHSRAQANNVNWKISCLSDCLDLNLWIHYISWIHTTQKCKFVCVWTCVLWNVSVFFLPGLRSVFLWTSDSFLSKWYVASLVLCILSWPCCHWLKVSLYMSCFLYPWWTSFITQHTYLEGQGKLGKKESFHEYYVELRLKFWDLGVVC